MKISDKIATKYQVGYWYIMKITDTKKYTHILYVQEHVKKCEYKIKLIPIDDDTSYHTIYDSSLSSPKDCAYHSTYRILNKHIIHVLSEVVQRFDKRVDFWNKNICPKVDESTFYIHQNCDARHANYTNMVCLPYFNLIHNFVNAL